MESLPVQHSPELSNSPEKDFFDLQKENFEEYEKWRIKLQEVIQAIRAKGGAIKDVTAAIQDRKPSKDGNVHLLVMILGGGMQGPYGAGQLAALEEMGYTGRHLDSRDVFLGISTGAATCAFGMAGHRQVLLGSSYYYTICTTPAFINYFRLHRMLDVGVIESAMRNGPLRLDTDSVKKNPAQFYVQAFNENSSEPEFINAKDAGLDMVDAIHASMAIPLVYDKAIRIHESMYTDGGFDDPLPLERAISKFKPTHVLILPNIPFNQLPLEDPTKIRKAIKGLIPEDGKLTFFRKVLDNRQLLRRSFDTISKYHDVKIGVAWPPDMGLHPFIQDAEKIKDAIKISAKEMFLLFGEGERNLKL